MVKSKGFTACGKYYEMGETEIPYIEYCKKTIEEIRKNKLKPREV